MNGSIKYKQDQLDALFCDDWPVVTVRRRVKIVSYLGKIGVLLPT